MHQASIAQRPPAAPSLTPNPNPSSKLQLQSLVQYRLLVEGIWWAVGDIRYRTQSRTTTCEKRVEQREDGNGEEVVYYCLA